MVSHVSRMDSVSRQHASHAQPVTLRSSPHVLLAASKRRSRHEPAPHAWWHVGGESMVACLLVLAPSTRSTWPWPASTMLTLAPSHPKPIRSLIVSVWRPGVRQSACS